jgi:hypothetical protein
MPKGKPFKLGNKASSGRPKGAVSKFTTLKNAFLEAFELSGGTESLVEWINLSQRNRAHFYQLITKMLPSNVDVDHKGEIKHQIEFVAEYGDNGNNNGNGANEPE